MVIFHISIGFCIFTRLTGCMFTMSQPSTVPILGEIQQVAPRIETAASQQEVVMTVRSEKASAGELRAENMFHRPSFLGTNKGEYVQN